MQWKWYQYFPGISIIMCILFSRKWLSDFFSFFLFFFFLSPCICLQKILTGISPFIHPSIHSFIHSFIHLYIHFQDFEREVDAYRKRLQILPTIREEGESGVLDEEIESIEAKFKDISRECAKHMDRLAALVKNKKTFDDLNEKLATVYPALQEQVCNTDFFSQA